MLVFVLIVTGYPKIQEDIAGSFLLKNRLAVNSMKTAEILLGKAVTKVSKLRGGSGSALPGLVIEKIDKGFTRKILSRLPYGVVTISGTNGKTTTTKIITELLTAAGLRVFTNDTGSNFLRGVNSAIIQKATCSGKFNYDIAVLELDEAHIVKFSEQVPIDYSLFLNVQRDQLDRFAEIDHTAELLQKVASVVTKTVVLNREDPRVSKIQAKNTVFFGLSDELVDQFPSDDDLIVKAKNQEKLVKPDADVILQKIDGVNSTFTVSGKDYSVDLKLRGLYNVFNAAGALAICHQVLPDTDMKVFTDCLSQVKCAFGRGELLEIDGKEVEILLVKNPSAFQLSLASFADDKHDFMIAINDKYADGRDVSWLWNVDFSQLPAVAVTTGSRATDMTLRLKYDQIPVSETIEDFNQAITAFLKYSDRPKRIFATYTSMLEIRKILSGKSIL